MRSALLLIAVASCAAHTRWADAVESNSNGPSVRRIAVTAGRHGFSPSELHARAGEIVALEFTRMDSNTCVKRVRVYLDDDRQIERELPLQKPVTIALRLSHPGEVGISCAMQRKRCVNPTLQSRPRTTTLQRCAIARSERS
jgi:plastocyanin domain-containing protein